jgi:hypothetical protein
MLQAMLVALLVAHAELVMLQADLGLLHLAMSRLCVFA